MKKIISISFLLLLILTSCKLKDDTGTEPTEQPDNGFETKAVAAVFAQNCAVSGCHAGTTPPNGLSLETYDDLMRGSSM